MSKNDLLAVFRNLDEATIRQRLDELDEEYAALKTLLRSAMARSRAASRKKSPRINTGGEHG